MKQKLLICLGKYGDVIGLLPLLYADAQNGKRSAIMVAKEYAGLLDGISYADPFIFDGKSDELDKAVEWGKTLDKQIVCCQTAGPLALVEKFCYGPAKMPHAQEESFQKTAWRMAGAMERWKEQLPLVFDRRDSAREAALMKDWQRNKRHIVVAVDGKTSPFQYKELLMKLLELRYRQGYEIHDIGQIKAEFLYDLLGPIERAFAFIAADTAPLHLAYACRTPVVALINDRPLMWHGSVWRPNHICHIRYQDFPRRCVEMLDAIDAIGTPGNRFADKTKEPRIIHCWSQYEITEENKPRHAKARSTWQKEYASGHWVSTPVELGCVGRDTRSSLKDEKRYIFVRDNLRIASLRAGDGDYICVTRPDTCFTEDITVRLLQHPLSYAHRMVAENGQWTWHPTVDLFCMPKTWWQAHQKEMPDMVLGNDIFWPRVLMELMKSHGAVELPMAIYRMPSKKKDA